MITRCLLSLGTLCLTWPWRVIACFAVLTLVAIPLVVQLPLEADLRETLPGDIVHALERHRRLFGKSDLAFLLVQTETRSQTDLIAFANTLAQQLTDSPLIRSVQFGYPPPMLQALNDHALDYAPLFVGPEDIETFNQLLTAQGIQAQLRKTRLELSAIGSGLRDRLLLDDPLQLRRFALKRFAALRGSFRFNAFSPYFLSPDGNALLIKVEGRAPVDDMAGAKATVALLEQTLQDVLSLPDSQGLTVQGTGGYFLAAESERVIRRDLIRSINLAVLLICILMVWTFRRWGVVLYGQLPTLVGLWLALGVFALLRPKLNTLTLGCAAALIGLGIDFTVHILTQCFVEFGKGHTTQVAIQTSIRETGSSLIVAGATTIAAFSAFLFSGQHFLQDMGVLADLGIFFCLLLSLILLPSLLAVLPHKKKSLPPRDLGIPGLMRVVLKAPIWVLTFSLVLCLSAVAALIWRPPGFETDLRNIHAADSPALRVQAKIATLFGGSQEPLTVLLEGDTETQVFQAMQRLQPGLNTLVEENLLAAVTSLGAIYPTTDAQQAVLRRLQTKDPDVLGQILTASLNEAGFDVTGYATYIASVRNLLTLRTPLNLSGLKTLGIEDLWRSFLGHDDLGAAGLIVLFPKQELWRVADRNALSQRVTDLLATLGLQGALTGLYTISSASAARIGMDFRRITLLALVLIGTIVCLRFRYPKIIGLVFLPVFCGALWTAGLFALFDLKLNFMNIAILPMLLGIGIDDGIHIVHRFQTCGSRNVQDALAFTGTAVCLTSLTTLLAFGTLALSVNQGIASVGLVSLIGITASLLASITTLPAALKVWEEKTHEDMR